VAFRRDWQAREPGWFNGAVSSVGGGEEARLLILGLAPGLRGANRTGIPFTGDASGAMLFMALARPGFAEGAPGPDGIPELHGAMITNVVRCVPPQNRPAAAEVAACRPFLAARLAALPRLRAVLCLGGVAHAALTDALGARRRDHVFAHGSRHRIGGFAVFDSYHCSRLNTNTGRLTPEMLDAVMASIRRELDGSDRTASD
jgi:uracil-DNA glycosylase family 4